MDRWPAFHQPALRWVARVERAIKAHNHPDQGAFIAITNAIEYQLEIGAQPDTLRLLLSALAQFATSCGIGPDNIGLDPDPEATLAKLSPRRSATR
jgi:hypothetical protein